MLPVEVPYEALFEIVRSEETPSSRLDRLIELGVSVWPMALWSKLQFDFVDIERDVEEVTAWLDKELEQMPTVRGVCFWLDTLNMNEGLGSNVEINLSETSMVDDLGWAIDISYGDYGVNQYGVSHYGFSYLIRGLVQLQNCYDREDVHPEER